MKKKSLSKQNYIKLNVAETRKNIGRIMEDIFYNNATYVLARRGRPYVIMKRVRDDELKHEKKEDDLLEIAKKAHKLLKKKVDIQEVMDDVRS